MPVREAATGAWESPWDSSTTRVQTRHAESRTGGNYPNPKGGGLGYPLDLLRPQFPSKHQHGQEEGLRLSAPLSQDSGWAAWPITMC